jgi:hypothetical protein
VLNTPSLTYPAPLGAPNSGPINGALGCIEGEPTFIAGHISGNCGASTGAITFGGVGPQDYIVIGTTMHIGPGGATGTLTILPAVGQSCLTGTTVFMLAGSVIA